MPLPSSTDTGALSAADERALADGVVPVGEDAGMPIHWFALEETAAAHDAVESGVTGKVLIRVADEGSL